jgi:hypothetical protein
MSGYELIGRANDLGLWHEILVRSGVPVHYLTGKHGPCPMCGGKDRFRWDNKDDTGSFFCNGCGAGYGLHLLMRFHKIGTHQALRMVEDVIGPTRGPPPAGGWVRRAPQRDDGIQLWYLQCDHCGRYTAISTEAEDVGGVENLIGRRLPCHACGHQQVVTPGRLWDGCGTEEDEEEPAANGPAQQVAEAFWRTQVDRIALLVGLTLEGGMGPKAVAGELIRMAACIQCMLADNEEARRVILEQVEEALAAPAATGSFFSSTAGASATAGCALAQDCGPGFLLATDR